MDDIDSGLKEWTACLMEAPGDPGQEINRLVAMCGELFKADYALYNRLEGHVLYAAGQWNPPPGYRARDDASGHICFEAIQRGLDQPIVIRNLQDSIYAQTDPNVNAYGLRTYIGIPIMVAGMPKGSLCMIFQRDVTPGEEHMTLLAMAAHAIAAVEERLLSSRKHNQIRAELSLQAQIIDSLHESIVVTDLDERIIHWNRGAENLYGFRAEEVLGKFYRDVAGSVRPEGYPPSFKDDLLKHGKWNGEHWQRRKDGKTFWSDTHISVLRDANGKPAGFIGIDYDVTARRHAMEHLEITRQSYVDLINTITEAIYVQDETGAFIDVNEGAARMYRCTRQDLIGKHPRDVAAPGKNNLEETEKMSAAVFKTGEPAAFDFWAVRADGELFFKEVIVHKGRYFGKDVLIATARDQSEKMQVETEKTALQSQLTHALKMESIGRVAGGIAHDFNNMLGIIIGNADLAMKDMDPASPHLDALLEIKSAASRSTELSRQLLAFARRQPVSPRVMDLNATIKGMMKMLRRLIDERVALEWDPDPQAGCVMMDPSQLDQVVINLCVNARDAVHDTGTISIRTSTIELDKTDCAQFIEAKPGSYAIMRVEDSGCGIEPDVIEHIFEPFFTTKGEGEGTGLGLATVYGIVRQNHGFIHVESEPGRGTIFQIFLPRRGNLDDQETRSEVDYRTSRRERILLVEDEPCLLTITTKMLEQQGYRVIPASSPTEALEMARSYPAPINLLLTDVVMPVMNGWNLAEAVIEMRPGIKVLFISGYGANLIKRQITDGIRSRFLQKPFTAHQLGTLLTDMLQ